jgi:hypothetical protein
MPRSNESDNVPPDQPAAWGALDEIVETEYYPSVVTRYPQNVMLHGSRISGMNNERPQRAASAATRRPVARDDVSRQRSAQRRRTPAAG